MAQFDYTVQFATGAGGVVAEVWGTCSDESTLAEKSVTAFVAWARQQAGDDEVRAS
jgi:hypothetical protein